MKPGFLLLSILIILLTITGCSKKTQPASTATVKPAETKAKPARPLITAIPKVIAVNDKAAKRSVDGRYYYDLNGHRYWRNNKDGKYYLFNKSMFDNPDFKSPGN